MINKYPYSDMHELNADWLLSKTVELEGKVKDIEEAPKGVTSVTPYYNSGTKIADYEQNGVAGEMYIPNNPAVLEKSAINRFDDGIDSYFKKVVSSIVPVQAGSGTPSPTNMRAISGFTECTVLDRGINQWNEQWELGIINDTTGIPQPGNGLRSKDYIDVIANISYYMLWNSANYGNNCYRMEYDSNKNFLRAIYFTGGKFQVSNDCKYIKFYIWRASTNPINGYYNDVSINYPATDTDYHAYNGTTATISFGSAGTVYGGYVDLVSGKLVVDKGYIAPTEVIEVMTPIGAERWRIALNDLGITGVEGAFSSHFNAVNADNPGCFYITSSGGSLVVLPTDQSLNTKALADAWLQANNPQFVYKLATPREYQLTPAQLRSLIGANGLMSSTGEVTNVEYITNDTIAWLLDQIV